MGIDEEVSATLNRFIEPVAASLALTDLGLSFFS
jgi:hypothetical protein